MRRFSMSSVIVVMCFAVLSIVLAQTIEDLNNPPPGEWPTHSRTTDNVRFSPLDQISRDNVGNLRLVWSRALGFEGQVQSSPVVWDGVMYINGVGAVLALDATSGDLIWEYRPELAEATRGVAAGRMRGGVVVFDGKVYYNRNDGIVVALDAETGEEVWSTTVGDIELAEGFSSGPLFANGKIISGTTGADSGGVPGRLHALDAEDGELLWTFNAIPEPGEPGYETWSPNPPSLEAGVGGAAMWNVGAYDSVTNTIIWGTGQPIPWERFTTRSEEGDEVSADLYTASYVAVDADTGEMKWYFQVVPGDEWDYDQQTSATVTDMQIDGETRRVVILPSTTGYVFIRDIETGEHIRAFGNMQPEYTIASLAEDGTLTVSNEGRMTESGQTVLLCPMRWVNFQQASYNPDTGIYFRPNVWDCREYTQHGIPDDWQPGDRPLDFEFNVLYDRFERYGGITAIDLQTGEAVWDYGHGYDQRGGLVATAGDLVFAVFEDRHFRAFDAETGDILWEQVLPAMMRSNPITYEVDGVQYVAALVGHPSAETARADLPPTVPGPAAAFVFALPEGQR
jgi:PQQ-dependent dehydrogenase (methanol/ethanol family)